MSPGLRNKAQDAALRFLKFSVSVALTRRLRFLRFLRFSVYYAIYKTNRGFEIFEVFSFNRTDKAFEIFLSNGDLGHYNTIRRGPQSRCHQVRPPSPRKLLDFSSKCSQVLPRYKVPFLLQGGGVQKQTTHQKTKTKLSSATPNRDKTIHCQRKRRKKHPASNVAAESAPHPRHAAKACVNNTQTIPNNMVFFPSNAYKLSPGRSPRSTACCISVYYLIKAVTLSIFTEGGLQKKNWHRTSTQSN